MTLDLSTVRKIADQCGCQYGDVCSYGFDGSSALIAFAQACYAMGAAEQRERDAKICEELKSKIYEYSDRIVIDTAKNVLTNCAKAIRSQE